MLLERDLIQSVGFRNVRQDGEITGFQFRVRMPSYRGMAASLIDGIGVRIPGLVDVAPDVPTWTLQGKTYSLAELWECEGVRWLLEDAAVVTVPFPGGLPDGIHELSIDLRLRMSYIPQEHQPSRYEVTKHVTLTPEAPGGPFRYGVSLYSYMGDYGTNMDLETAIAAIADRCHRGRDPRRRPRPNTEPTDGVGGRVVPAPREYSLEPTNYGSWIDTRLHPRAKRAA